MHIVDREVAMTKNEELLSAVIAAAEDRENKKYLSCISALQLAEQFDVEAPEIRRICDEQKIKLHQCQLGCF